MGLIHSVGLRGESLRLQKSCENSVAREVLQFGRKKLESMEEIAKRVVWIEDRALWDVIEEAISEVKGLLFRVDVEVTASEEEVLHLRDELEQIDSESAVRLKQDIISSLEKISKKMDEYPEALWYPLLEEEKDVVTSRIGSGRHKPKMIGLSDVYADLKHKLITHEPRKFETFSIVGMPGIGKTTLANEIFEDPDIVQHFSCRAWVTVGRKCRLEEILRLILAEVNHDGHQMLVGEDGDTVREYLEETLKGKRYLIVLDDVWGQYMMFSWEILPFPSEHNGSSILLTSRQPQLFKNELKMRLLDTEDSWNLLREKVFAEGCCPSQLEDAGKKIAKNCIGLPLTIVKVAELLSKEEKTTRFWSEVAKQKNHHLFKAAYDEISKVLLPSYKYLPLLLKMCLLYMGAFPANYEIPRSKLINMWNVDGFPELDIDKSQYPQGAVCLMELVNNNVVMTYKSTIYIAHSNNTSGIGGWISCEGKEEAKTCGLHSSLWHLCNREAEKDKFLHILSSYNDALGEGIKRQRPLSFHNNILFGIKDVHKSVEDNCASTAHCLLCYGPYHKYQVPICFSLRLLTEVDALTIRFYEFPMEVLQLVQLKYLALTLNGKLPASISQLSDLQFLIVDRHLRIKTCRDPSYLPAEIWNMNELKHLQVMGNDLPNPPLGASMKSLSTLLNVSVHSCTKGILKAIPHLEKLGIQIELAPNNDGKLMSCFDQISHLEALKSFKYVAVNPEVVSPLAPLSIFPLYLQKLSLSGLGYPWKEMSKIASLNYLRKLKLQNYAFRGPKWEEKDWGFHGLNFLIIEDTDLVEWKIGHGGFNISYLRIKSCYKLERSTGFLLVCAM